MTECKVVFQYCKSRVKKGTAMLSGHILFQKWLDVFNRFVILLIEFFLAYMYKFL